MKQGTRTSIDERLLSHHPAGKECLDVCTANGWVPNNGDLVRLVRLREQVRAGQRAEVVFSRNHLEFARWLREHGRIGEDLAS